MDSNTLRTIGTGVTVILSVAGAAIAMISVVPRFIADVRADMCAEIRADVRALTTAALSQQPKWTFPRPAWPTRRCC